MDAVSIATLCRRLLDDFLTREKTCIETFSFPFNLKPCKGAETETKTFSQRNCHDYDKDPFFIYSSFYLSNNARHFFVGSRQLKRI